MSNFIYCKFKDRLFVHIENITAYGLRADIGLVESSFGPTAIGKTNKKVFVPNNIYNMIRDCKVFNINPNHIFVNDVNSEIFIHPVDIKIERRDSFVEEEYINPRRGLKHGVHVKALFGHYIEVDKKLFNTLKLMV